MYTHIRNFRNGDKINGPEILDHRKNAFSNFQSPEKRNRTKIACHSNNVTTSTVTIPQTSSEIVELNTDDLKYQLLQLSSQINKCLEAEILLIRKENEQLKLKMSSISECLSYELISSNDELIKVYTGLPNSKVFDLLILR
ncbi:THAP-type domain-containing protein [Aphis craccivora]|uniref:THAP-type domain-containing protein n=1 Tax=Aphis craccivora TaxID=307492 RepID=A0A6G0YBP1_APHCR|nr:THAP-type domain-containing protein [Aphis craccivora]